LYDNKFIYHFEITRIRGLLSSKETGDLGTWQDILKKQAKRVKKSMQKLRLEGKG
jgi:hypothetical protein